MPKQLSSKSIALLSISLASFLTAFTGSSLNIALPAIGKELSISAVTLSWVNLAYILSANVCLLPMGKFADLRGRTRIFSYGTGIYSAASLGCGLSWDMISLLLCRVLQGLGGAMLFGTGVAILSDFYPPKERGRALGISTAAIYLGLSLGPPLGGFLTHNFGWRKILFVSALLGMIVFFLAFWKLKRPQTSPATGPFDSRGAFLWGSALVTAMYGLTHLSTIPGFLLALLGAYMFVLFARSESQKEAPLLDFKLFSRSRAFTFSSLAALINYSSTHGIGFLFSIYLQYIKGLPPQAAGLIMISQPAVMAIFSPFAGRLSDRIEPRVVSSLGMALTVVGLVISIFLHSDSPLLHIIASLVILGLGFSLFASPNTNAIMSSVEKKDYGVASAIVATMRLTGQTLSMGIVTLVFAFIIWENPISPEYYPSFLKSMHLITATFSVLCFFGIFASLARGKIRQ